MKNSSTRLYRAVILMSLSLCFSAHPALSEPLSAELLKSISEAVQSGEFSAEILERKHSVSQKTQSVVILGEAHFKHRDAQTLGKNIIQHFSVFGTEGTKAKNQEQIDLVEKQFQKTAKKLYQENASGGSIDDIIDRPSIPLVLQPVYWLIQAYDSKPEDAKTVYYPKFLKAYQKSLQLAEYCFESGMDQEFIFNPDHYDELVARLRHKFYKNPALEIIALEYFEEAPPIVEDYLLWKAYVARTIAQSELVMLGLSSAKACLYNSVLALAFGCRKLSLASGGAAILSYGATSAYALGWLNHFLPNTRQAKFPLPDVDEIQNQSKYYMRHLIEDRDPIMGRSIDQALNRRPDAEKILVIVGKSHVSGVKKILMETYDFGPVAF
jgi:hypothetical protein